MKLGVSSKDSLLFGMILVSNLILGCAWQKKKKKKRFTVKNATEQKTPPSSQAM